MLLVVRSYYMGKSFVVSSEQTALTTPFAGCLGNLRTYACIRAECDGGCLTAGRWASEDSATAELMQYR